MNENMIYKMVFEEIAESLEWGNDCKDHHYAWYIDGVISVARRMLEKLNDTCEEE